MSGGSVVAMVRGVVSVSVIQPEEQAGKIPCQT